jgi:serine/threonine-protein kinase
VEARADCPDLPGLERHLRGEETEALASHLKGCAACATRLAGLREEHELALELRSAGARSRASERVEPLPVLAGYELEGEIHRGGQGIVYRALQRSTKRTVAIKLLLDGAFASERQRLRFEREVELVASLDHPGVVTVFDSGVTAGGQPFLAMELVEGLPLDEAWQTPPGRKSDRTRLLRTSAAIAEAVHFAHQHGVLHRDLKPQNILVDAEGRPHVVDFGVARALAAGDDERALHTRTGAFLGTLAYASPEQVAGDPRDIDVRSDVYSLGVVLYERLVGCFPYPVDGGPGDVTRSILEAEPKPPRKLDSDLATILFTALAKEPQRRYQTARDLQRDLERYVANQPISARADSTLYLLRRLLHRHRVPAVALGLVLTATIAAALVSFVFWQQAVAAAEKASGEGDRAMRSLNLFERMLVAPDHREDAVGPMTLREALDWASARVEVEFSDFPGTELEVRELLANAYLRLGDAEQADTHLRRVLLLRRELHGEETVETAKAMGRIARHYQKELEALRHGFPPGREFSRRERPLFVPLERASEPVELTAHQRSKLEGGLELELDAEAILRREEPDEPDVGLSNRRVHALILHELGRASEAERELRAILDETRTATHESLLEQHARALGELCVMLADDGRFDEAETSLRELVERRDGVLGARSPEALLARNNLAAILLASGQSAEAKELLEEVCGAAPGVFVETDWRLRFFLANRDALPRDVGRVPDTR